MKVFLLALILTVCCAYATTSCGNVDKLLDNVNSRCENDCDALDQESCLKAINKLSEFSTQCDCDEECQETLADASDYLEECQENQDLEQFEDDDEEEEDEEEEDDVEEEDDDEEEEEDDEEDLEEMDKKKKKKGKKRKERKERKEE